MKNIGKPCAGEPHARFDEGGLKRPHLLFHSSRVRQTDLKDAEFAVSSLLYPSSVRNIKAALSGVLSSAYEDGLIPGNPALQLGKLIKKTDSRKDINPLIKEEVLVMLKTAMEHFPRYYPVFLLAVSTGMRLGEVIGLQPGDVDFKGRFIEVRRAIVRGRVETPKSGKSRRVDMSQQLTEAVKVHLLRTKELTLKKGWKQPPETLFYNDEGRPLDPNNVVKRCFHNCLQKAGLRRVRFHDLRHTFASIHISQGESLAYVRDQLGHHSIQITVDIYGHWCQAQINLLRIGYLTCNHLQPIRNQRVLSHKKSTRNMS